MNRTLRATRVLAVLSVVAAASVSCGGEPGSSAGIPDVDALPDLVLAEELRLGSVDDPDVGFTGVDAVDVDRDGNLYVLETHDREVRVYDPEGRRIRTIGGPGEGPGELLSNPYSMGVVGDTVWVSETFRGRTTLFRRDGSFVSVVQGEPTAVEIGEFVAAVSLGGMRPDGRFVSTFSYRGMSDPPPDTFPVPRLVYDGDGVVVDTAGYHPYSFGPRGELLGIGGRDVRVPAASTRPLRTDDGERVVIVDRTPATSPEADELSVTRVSPVTARREDGAALYRADTLAHHRYRYRPRPFDDATVDSLVLPRVAIYEAVGLDPDVVEAAMRRALVLPAFHPPVSFVRLAADGGLWLRREEDGGPAWRWLRIDPDGSPRGHVVLDRRASIRWGTGETIWVVERDDLDVPWLVRYRVGG